MRSISMNADGICRNGDHLAAQGNYHSVFHHPDYLRDRDLGIGYDGIRQMSRRECAVILVGTIRKHFTCCAKPCLLPARLTRLPTHTE